MTIIHYDETSEFGQDMLDLIALLGWMMDEEQEMNKGAVNSGLRIAQGKIQGYATGSARRRASHTSKVTAMIRCEICNTEVVVPYYIETYDAENEEHITYRVCIDCVTDHANYVKRWRRRNMPGWSP